LVEYFANYLAGSTGLGKKSFSAEAVGYLSGLSFRGNVRELRNIIERCYIMSRAEDIDLEELQTYLGGDYELGGADAESARNSLTSALRNFEKSFLTGELAKVGGNISELARSLGIDRGNLSRKLKSYGLV
jgi:two-component system nitrogen regulation response regulator NtrX